MKRFIEGEIREQGTLLPEQMDDYVGADNPVRVVDVFVYAEFALRALESAPYAKRWRGVRPRACARGAGLARPAHERVPPALF